MMLEIHPYAEMFPQMTTDEFDAFCADVSENGVLMPVMLFQGKILDGRHRQQAVDVLQETTGQKIPFETQEFAGDESAALRYAFSANIRRRHLTVGQLACVNVKLKKSLQETIKAGNPNRAEDGTFTNSCHLAGIGDGKEAAEIAAQITGASARSTYRAEKVLNEAPDLFERVQAGDMPLGAAETALAIRKGEQTPAQAVRAVAEEITAAIGVANITENQLDKIGRLLLNDTTAHVGQNTGVPEWYTPSEFIEAARLVMGDISLDPASCERANQTVRALRYYDAQQDGLSKEWGGAIWLNPPYSAGLIDKFTAKLCSHFAAGEVEEAIVLVNNATETGWFQSLALHAAAICFPSSRVKFLDAEGKPGAPLQGQAILYLGCYPQLFLSEFKPFGFCAIVPEGESYGK